MRNQARALQSLTNHLWGVEEALEQEAVLAKCRSALDARRSLSRACARKKAMRPFLVFCRALSISSCWKSGQYTS